MRRVHLREAAVMLVLARLAVCFVPPAVVFAWANRPPRRIHRFAVDQVTWISWAVDHLGRKARMRALCLPRALAAHAMLRRRGVASRLCLGIAHEAGAHEAGALAAHAWVEVGGEAVVGGAEAAKFTRLAEFGAASR
jgi:hypothetical protein